MRHEYQPGVGFTPLETGLIDSRERKARVENAKHEKDSQWIIDDAEQLDRACVDRGLERTLVESGKKPGLTDDAKLDQGYVEMVWVDYILTTANGWKTPIHDFQLEIEKPQTQDYRWYVSFCWDGPVQRLDATRFRARANDFRPGRDLHVAFFRAN